MTEDSMMFLDYINSMSEEDARKGKSLQSSNSPKRPSKDSNGYVYVKLISGKRKYALRKDIVGFCHCSLHEGSISKSLLKEHDCIGKKCVYFERNNKEYWNIVDSQNNRKREKKERRKAIQIKAKNEIEEWKQCAQRIADTFDYNLRVTSVKKPGEKQHYIIYYISEWEYDDRVRFGELATTFGYAMAGKAELRHVKELDGSYAVI